MITSESWVTGNNETHFQFDNGWRVSITEDMNAQAYVNRRTHTGGYLCAPRLIREDGELVKYLFEISQRPSLPKAVS